MAQADSLWVHLYGDMYTPTSGGQPDSASVLYDDLQVSSVARGPVVSETFEAGVTVGSDPDSTTSWTSSGEVVQSAVWDPAPTTWKRDVLYLGGQAIAEIDAAGVHELHADHLGTPKLITKGYGGADKGTIEGRQEFGAYGEKLITSGYVPLTGYTGHVQTDSTGLIYMRARYYSPAWHRFLTSDQGIDPSTWNQVAYVGGSPFMATDPTGNLTIATCENGIRLLWYRNQEDPNDGWHFAGIDGFCSSGNSGGQSTGGEGTSGLKDPGSGGRGGGGANTAPGSSLLKSAATKPSSCIGAGPKTDQMTTTGGQGRPITGGYFSFGGREVDGAEGGVFSGVIHEYDSARGHSWGQITEGWIGGEGGLVGIGKITSRESPLQGVFIFGGGGISAGPLGAIQVGVVGGLDGWVGVYYEWHVGEAGLGWAGGQGAYVNCGNE